MQGIKQTIQKRTAREQILLVIAGVLLAVFLIWQIGIKPVCRHYDLSKQRYEQSAHEYEMVQKTLSVLAANRTAAIGQVTPLKPVQTSDLIRLAKQSGLVISRVQPNGEHQSNIWINGATTSTIFIWLNLIEQEYGDHVLSLDLSAGMGQSIDAYLVFNLSGDQNFENQGKEKR